jgi:hypothetical protein
MLITESSTGNGENGEAKQSYMSTYAYWLKYPYGWNYPAACASESGKKGGWAASVDSQTGNNFD